MYNYTPSLLNNVSFHILSFSCFLRGLLEIKTPELNLRFLFLQFAFYFLFLTIVLVVQ